MSLYGTSRVREPQDDPRGYARRSPPASARADFKAERTRARRLGRAVTREALDDAALSPLAPHALHVIASGA